jgi:hypothetical protein
MTFLFIVLSLFGFLFSFLNCSLIVSRRNSVVYSLLQALPVLILLPLILKTPLPFFLNLGQQPESLRTLALTLILENCIALFMTISALKVHYGLSRYRTVWLFYVPSLSAVAGVVLMIALVMNTTTGTSYEAIGLWGVFLFAALVFFVGFIVEKVIPSWAARLELKALISVLAICISCAIPLLNSPMNIQGIAVDIRFMDTLILSLILVIGIGAGYGIYLYSVQKKSKHDYR